MYPQQGYADIVIKRVVLGKRARKQLKKVPKYVAEKLTGWVSTVEETGVEDARKIPGYHDEPQLGARKGNVLSAFRYLIVPSMRSKKT